MGAESPSRTRQLAQPPLSLRENTFLLVSAGRSQIIFHSPNLGFPDSTLGISQFLLSVGCVAIHQDSLAPVTDLLTPSYRRVKSEPP